MKSITLRSHVGEDGVLKLQVPLDVTNTDLEVMVIVQPIADTSQLEAAQEKSWSPGFFEEVIGGWEGEPLVRESQGEYEDREEFQ